MIHWTLEQAELNVKRCISDAAKGGGYILTDHHGNLPINVPDKILRSLVKLRDKYGSY